MWHLFCLADFFPFRFFIIGVRWRARGRVVLQNFKVNFERDWFLSLIWLLNAWPAAKAVNRGLIFLSFFLFSFIEGEGLFWFLFWFFFFLWAGIEQRGNVSLKSYHFDFLKRQITIIVGEGGRSYHHHGMVVVCSKFRIQPSQFPFINVRRESLLCFELCFRFFFQQHTQLWFFEFSFFPFPSSFLSFLFRGSWELEVVVKFFRPFLKSFFLSFFPLDEKLS